MLTASGAAEAQGNDRAPDGGMAAAASTVAPVRGGGVVRAAVG
ncbi:hypothetical protein [Teichococcus coralli]|nr:hypothetical protein [Pseudoroseomonas coralli]